MRALLVLAVLAWPKLVHVTGTATRVHETWPCKGGVLVTPDMVETETKPLSQATFTLYAGGGPDPVGRPVAKLKTDAKGRFALDLAPGAYCLVQGDLTLRPDAGVAPEPDAPPRFSKPGFESEGQEPAQPKCDAHIDVGRESPVDATFHLYSRNPCSQPWAKPGYRGPSPP